MFEKSVIQKLKQIFKFGCGDSEVFTYTGIELQQNDDYSIIISQKSYLDSIKEIILDKERIKKVKDQLTEIERKDYRRAVGKLNWVSGISQPDISFYVCDTSTKFQNATITDALKVNKVIKHLKSTTSFIKVPKFDKESLKLQLYTDASFNNLPNGGSQAGQILFLSDYKNNCFPLHWNSSKLKQVVRSTLAAETLSLSDGCDVTFYVNILLSELIQKNSKPMNIIAYTDNQSLHDTVHSTKQTLERKLIHDISSICEMVDNNQIQVIWVEKDKQTD